MQGPSHFPLPIVLQVRKRKQRTGNVITNEFCLELGLRKVESIGDLQLFHLNLFLFDEKHPENFSVSSGQLDLMNDSKYSYSHNSEEKLSGS